MLLELVVFCVLRVFNLIMEQIKVIVKFSKTGMAKYISHLDFLRFFYRALRRSQLPCVYTQGFSRRPKVQFGQALKVGEAGEMDTTFILTEFLELKYIRERIEQQLTNEISIVGIDYGK